MARPPSADARAALLRAADDILVERGVALLTVDEVVRRSGVAKTTLYRHFGTLDGLVFALVGARVRAASAPDTGSLRGDLLAIQRSYLDGFDDRPGRELFVWMVTKAMHDPAAAELFARARHEARGPTTQALQRAIARGEIAPTTDLELAMHVIQGPLISKRVIGNAEVTVDELETLVDMAVAALSGVPPAR